MVSGSSVNATVILLMATAMIVHFMTKNSMNIEEYSLLEACRVAEGNGDNFGCDYVKRSGWDWDTKIACSATFKDDVYYWTPAMIIPGVKKGLTMGESLKAVMESRCLTDEVLNDPDLVAWRKWYQSGDREEKRELEEEEDREMWGRRRRRRRRAPPPPTYPPYPRNGGTKCRIGLCDYKACSSSLAFAGSTGKDYAQCAIKNYPTRSESQGNHWCRTESCAWYNPFCHSNFWCGLGNRDVGMDQAHNPGSPRGTGNTCPATVAMQGSVTGWNDILNVGCIEHDTCLIYAWKDGGDCDEDLATRACRCVANSNCDDNSASATVVCAAMSTKPNAGGSSFTAHGQGGSSHRTWGRGCQHSFRGPNHGC